MRLQLETLKVSIEDTCFISHKVCMTWYSFQDIRRHLMTKRPQVMRDPEDGSKNTDEAHKSHHHPSKNHVNRHHKKHDHTTTLNPTASTIRPIVKHNQVAEDRTAFTDTTEKPRFNVTVTESTDIDTTTTTEPTSTTLSTTSKQKKAPRRQKMKEVVGNRTEVEDDKPQRRRKFHHHRKNNTLFTNSVHDETPIVNVSETMETTVTTQSTIPNQRHQKYHQTKYATVPTTTMKETTIRKETSSSIGTTNDFTKETTIGTNAQTVLSTGSETGSTLGESTEPQRTTPVFPRTSTEARSRTFPSTTVTTTPMTTPVTASSTRRFPKVQKNRTTNLGPSRIDVTILESPDRRNRQG